MSFLPALTLLALLAGSADPGWKQVAREDGITVLSRSPEGSSVAELKATALMEAPPQEVWRVIRDYAAYTKIMPYTEESRVLASEQGGRVMVLHCLVNAPLVDRREFIIRLLDESDWREGQGYLKVSWTVATEGLPPAREGVVRVPLNTGYWLLEPREEGRKTFATYYLHTDPGGALPRWVANKANRTSLPDVLRAVRKHASGAGR
jgi:hypothetical protein